MSSSIVEKINKGNLMESILDNLEEKWKYNGSFEREKHRQIIGQKRRLQYYKRLKREIYDPEKNRGFSTETKAQQGISCNKVWFLWLDGVEKAPEIVKACKNSIEKQLCRDGRHELVALDKNNLSQYITLPAYIEEKHERGVIGHAQYADLVRLELLLQYGGLWMDSTVFLTGNRWISAVEKSELFFPNGYYFFSGETMPINNWMIFAKSGDATLQKIQRCLYRYWEKYDFEMDYFIFHIFASMVLEDSPEVMEQMPFLCQHASEFLQMNYHKKVNENVLASILAQTEVHKLNYKDLPAERMEGTYYEWILEQ